MRYFIFNGTNSKTYFWTNKIRRPLLAPVVTPTFNVPQRNGSYPLKSYLDEFTIDITVTAIDLNLTALRSKLRTIAAWLYTTEEKKLVFSDEQDKYYNARLSGNTDLEELAATGQTTLTFILSSPYAISETERNLLFASDGTISITNNGTAPVYAWFRLVPLVDRTYLRIDNLTTSRSITLNTTRTAWNNTIFDMDKNEVYDEDTGVNLLADVDITGDFFALEVGENNLSISPVDNADPTTSEISARVIFRERFI